MIRARPDMSADEVAGLEERLYGFNVERTGYADGEDLAFVAEDSGQLIGAVAGYTWGGICELRQVWVEEAHRGTGLGRSLMEAALAEAQRRGCAFVYLNTYDFQAPGFYKRLGFEEIARVEGKPLGHTDFTMRLSLGGARP